MVIVLYSLRGDKRMLEKLAKGTARFFVAQNIVEAEYEEVYSYGMEILLSTVINGIAAVIISIITNTVFPSLLFLTVFILMRRTGGGYHAKTHLGCMMILIAVQLLFVVFIKIMPAEAIAVFSYLTIIYACVSVHLYAPIEHPNKPLTQADKLKLRTQSLIIILSISVICIILTFTHHSELSLYMSSGILVSTTGMLAEKMSLSKKRSKQIVKEVI